MAYKSKRAYKLDRKKRAKYKPRKRFKKGLGGSDDWARKKYRGKSKRKIRTKKRKRRYDKRFKTWLDQWSKEMKNFKV